MNFLFLIREKASCINICLFGKEGILTLKALNGRGKLAFSLLWFSLFWWRKEDLLVSLSYRRRWLVSFKMLVLIFGSWVKFDLKIEEGQNLTLAENFCLLQFCELHLDFVETCRGGDPQLCEGVSGNIKPSKMEVAPLHRTVDITQKRVLFKNTKKTKKRY